MSGRYKVSENDIPHFVTFTVVGWIDVFTREIYKEKLVESLKFCVLHKGLIIYAWIIMPNHIHLIISSKGKKISEIVRDFKKYTSSQITEMIKEHPLESRKTWMLNIFSFAGKRNNSNTNYQFWKHDYHPIELDTYDKFLQRLNYLHENPVRAGLVWEAWHYKYSSAIDYYTDKKGLIEVEII